MNSKIITALIAAAAVTAGCSAAHAPHHHPQPVAATSSAADLSCQIAQTAQIRAEGALQAGFSTATLAQAATIWKLAVQKIDDSGVPPANGHLVADIDMEVVWADDAILALDLGKESQASKANDKLLKAEQKVSSDCP